MTGPVWKPASNRCEDDTLIVWKLDRLGRNLRHLVNTVHDLTARGIGFKGGTYEHLFYVADVKGAGPVMNGELHVAEPARDGMPTSE